MRILRLCLLGSGLFLTSGCADGGPDKGDCDDRWYQDDDGDGHGNPVQREEGCAAPDGYVADDQDCNDGNDRQHPGATETCNREDDDCNGVVDDAGGSTWYADADGDGFGAGAGVVATGCDAPDGHVSNTDDCDDGAADVSPDGQEVCDGGGTDEDCDGLVDAADPTMADGDFATWYPDVDGDGYGDAEGATVEQCEPPGSGYSVDPTDCDDSDPDVSPGAAEVCGNDLDDNCNGGSDQCGLSGTVALDAADVRIVGTAESQLGFRVLGIHDIDGDGLDDIAVSAHGIDKAYVFHGGATGALSPARADTTVSGDHSGEESFGGQIVAGDFDDDGSPDLVISDSDAGTTSQGSVYLFDGPLASSERSSAARTTWTATTSYTGLGKALSTGDWNGDGSDDLFLLTDLDVVYADRGPVSSGTITAADVNDFEASLAGASAVASGGDLDGDGTDDLVVSDQGTTSVSDSAAYVTTGGWTGAHAVSGGYLEATIRPGTWIYPDHSFAIDGDLDGDGYDDLLLGAFSADGAVVDSGVVYAYLGPITGTLGAADADVRLDGQGISDQFGLAVAYAGDENADGAVDVLVGAPQAMGSVDGAGAAYLYRGPLATGSRASPDATFLGTAAGDAAGSAVGAAGDFDGDGNADLLIGTRVANSYAGAAYIVFGGAL